MKLTSNGEGGDGIIRPNPGAKGPRDCARTTRVEFPGGGVLYVHLFSVRAVTTGPQLGTVAILVAGGAAVLVKGTVDEVAAAMQQAYVNDQDAELGGAP